MQKDFQLDAIDLQIVKKLQEDGRRSYAGIASELDLSPSTIQQRANRLIDHGFLIIKGMVHPDNLESVVTAMVAIKSEGGKLEKVASELSKLSEVRWVVICAGQYDILLEVVCLDNEHLLGMISERISMIDGVRDTITFPYLKVAKRTYEWRIKEEILENKIIK